MFGGGAGFVTAGAYGISFDGHDHADPAQHGGGHSEAAAHSHGNAVNLPAGVDAPGLAVKVFKDPMAGWNLHVAPTNFRFAPENASATDQPGEGHAHVYVNGVKLARLYGEWMHIPELPKGQVEVKVSLNTNSHGELTVEGIPVAASVNVEVE